MIDNKDSVDIPFYVGTASMIRIKASEEAPVWSVRKDFEPLTISNHENKSSAKIEYAYWGYDNKLPLKIVDAVYADPVLARGTEFNVASAYGDGIKPMLRFVENCKEKLVPCEDKKVLDFFDRHLWFAQYWLEQCTDMSIFYNTVAQLIVNEKKEVVRLKHIEAGYCRFSKRVGEYSPYVLYDDLFGDGDYDPSNTIAIPAINPYDPIYSVQEQLGLLPNERGIKNDSGARIFALRTAFPTPLKQYYSQPYYTSIFTSGWSEFSRLIPKFKKAILKNQATIKYLITIHPQYFKNLFLREGIMNQKEQHDRIRKEYSSIDAYLSGVDNSAKSIFSEGIIVKEELKPLVRIEVIPNHLKDGGEYLEDSEEVSNILSYAIGVHPSIIGAAPGKSKTINGTEARELMLIKNAITKPTRDLMLAPLYVTKALNKWPSNLVFVVPFTVLTTLDNGHGAEKNYGEAK